MKKSLLTKIGIFDYLRFLATFVVFLFGIQWVTAQCPTLVKVSVGECTNTGTGPRVLVAWYFDFDNSADVTITINDGNGNTFSKSIGPSHQGTPYYIQRIVTANGNTYNSTITYSGGCGSTSASYTLPAACNLNPSCGTGALGGRVFADYDLDGLQGGSEKGLKNVTVKIYNDAQNLVTTATSDINGNWLASGLTDGQKLRIEYDYSTFPTPIGYKLGKKAGSAGTTVQFATVPSCANNLGLFLEEIYSEPNPVVASIRFMNGDILSTDACSGAEQYLVITFNYNATNEQFGSEGFNVPVDRGVAKAKEVGSVWGMAWNKYTGHIYTSAFLRRHAGLGPNGIGAIYRSIQTAPGGAWTTSLLIDLAAAGYDLGQGDMDYTAAGRGLPACKNDPSRDIAAFSLIGKVGFGDIDLSSDGKTLYAMNLKNRSLIIMQLNDAGTAVLSHSEVVLPNPCADPYDWRPWGLKYYQGKVYVGGVNAGYSSVNKYPNDDYRRLRAYVYEYDPGTGVFSGPILKQPLDYPKTGDQSTTRWYIWEDTYSIQKSSSYNQPMLSDIEFDANGNILLAYADRGGYQWGWRNYLPHPTLTTLRDYFSNGDITKGYKNEPGIFLTEDNKVIGYDTGSGCGLTASQGPGGGEFYCGDNLHHPECAQGAIASHPSKNEMFMTYMDPVDIWSGGVGVLSHTTGQRLRGIEFYYMPGGAASGWHGKAGGVGDVELLSSPISAVKQVGNRIWIDLDIDGIQDPGESPLPNINVSLYDAGGTLIETTTTDANGEYYFEDYTPDATHYIVVGTGGQFNNGVLNNIYNMTVPNTGMGDIPDLNDSDGTAKPSGFLSGYPYIQITTPDIGQVNQSYDFGFYPCEITSLGAEALCDDNGTGTFLDDFFTIRVNPVGSGTSPNYNVTVVHDGNTTTYGPYSFGAASPYFGNFPIDGGNAQVTVTDAATGGCTLGPVTVNAPATCSFCEVSEANIQVECVNNNTETPSDDKFRLSVDPTGIGLGANYTVVVVHSGITYNYGPFTYGAPSPTFGNYLITGGDATVSIIDGAAPGCELGPETVKAPAYCSPYFFGCDDDSVIELLSTGVNCGSNPQTQITIPDPGSVTEVVVEVVYLNSYPGNSITVQSNFGNHTFNRVDVLGDNSEVYVYRGYLPAGTSSVSHNSATGQCGNGNGLQSLVSYVIRTVLGNNSVHSLVYTALSGYCDLQEFSIPVAANDYPRDIVVRLPITELSTDGTYMTITAEAGGVEESITIYGPPPGTCCINEVEITIPEVPGAANVVNVSIDTRSSSNPTGGGCGQSWVIAGHALVEAGCPEPIITHEKVFSTAIQTGPNSFDAIYLITVMNSGGAAGVYSLTDQPMYDDDVNIHGASFTSTAPGNPGTTLAGNGPWLLGNNINILAGAIHSYIVNVQVSIDLEDGIGDDQYDECQGGGSGSGLFNMSLLDVDGDTTEDETDEDCGELPYITHEKTISSVTQTTANTYNVVYQVVVQNTGGVQGQYDLSDAPVFDDDITINGANFTSTTPGNPGSALAGVGPWVLGDDINIAVGATHTYTLTVNVTLDLRTGTPGDNIYKECGDGTPGVPAPGEGLFNRSLLDKDNDGIPDETDEVCADLPYIIHEKTISSVTQTTANTYNVVYQVVVQNTGGAQGQYDLSDAPMFDNDITINSANYTSTAPGNAGSTLAGSGPWVLGNNININAGATHTYTLTVNVTLDLRTGTTGDNVYKECGDGTPGVPAPGEGLFNRSLLDVNNDGTPDQTDEVCGDLPYITHEKTISSVSQTTANTYNVVYQVVVRNTGGLMGQYDLSDTPIFDNDIAINSASYVSTAPGNAGSTLAGSGPWVLGNNINIAVGAIHTYTLTVNVTLDLRTGTGGDNIYRECGDGTPGVPAPGEGLFNRSLLDVNNDGTPDETDEVCADLPYIIHEKTISSVTQTAANNYNVVYQVVVQNIGGAQGQYDLTDAPMFDNDIAINNASYASTAPGNAGSALAGIGPWVLGNDINIPAGTSHTYTLTVNVTLDLRAGTTGDNIYKECGDGTPGVPAPGEGLFNRSLLDVNNDGTPDETDEVCADLPYIIHEKTISSVTQTTANTYNVVYQVVVQNTGGAQGQYDLSDAPMFDNDITINSANYTSTAPGNAGSTLAGSGPWVLGNNININAGATHTYTLTVNVTLDLRTGTTGDNVYKECGDGTPGVPAPGEGLFNRSLLDVNNDGTPDQTDEVCGDLPYITHEKTISSVSQTTANTYNVVYQVVVRNTGGLMGQYDLSDTPIFDNDIAINSASYVSTAPGNAGSTLAGSGPWVLGNNINIAVGAIHTYTLTVNVTLDLRTGTGGDNIYRECGDGTPGVPAPGEGLFNRSLLDVNNDGTPDETDEVCADLPYIIHEKTISSVTQTAANNYNVVYQVVVQNIGGAQGQYDLTDAPMFDNDIAINNASYASTAPGNAGSALAGIGPWVLGNDINIPAGTSHTYTLTVNVTLDLRAGTTGDNIYKECGDGTPGVPAPGEGLFNRSLLDVNNDSTPDETDEVCADLPYIIHEKTVNSVTQTGPHTYDVVYQVVVQNIGGANGQYDLNDAPAFDDDITINNAGYTSTAPGNAGSSLAGNGPWVLGNNVNIAFGATHTYTVTVNVTINLDEGTTGNNIYTACGETNPGIPTPGEGLFNRSLLDVNNDGTPDETDEACEDLPYIIHEKVFSTAIQTGPNSFDAIYLITVMNNGGASGIYTLRDQPMFDDDVIINSAEYSSTAPGNPGTNLLGTGPWFLGIDQSISAGAIHSYVVTVGVTIDLEDDLGDDEYDECEGGGPGSGMFNMSFLDVNGDTTEDETDEDCGEIPYVTHEKTISSVTQTAANTYNVVYQVVVQNIGGAEGQYDLTDAPMFDNDIAINNAVYTSTAPGNPGSALAGNGPWILGNDITIPAGEIHTYTLTVNVTLDLRTGTTGDNVYRECGDATPGVPAPGEGLFNRSLLDKDNDGTPDETDEVCADLPYIIHDKTVSSVTQTTPNTYNVVYQVVVQNIGGAQGQYDLNDAPIFDDDVTINAASYISTAPGNPGNALAGIGPWVLGNDINIFAGASHTYTLTVNVTLDLRAGTPGNNVYRACGQTSPGVPTPGEGLFNRSLLDVNNDGTPDQTDEVCADLPYIVHEKTVQNVERINRNAFEVTYQIAVRNLGGATGVYDLTDQPIFDDDLTITGSNYTSNAPGNAGSVLPGNGPWTLANDQAIIGGGVHIYTVTVQTVLDISNNSPGDNVVTNCGSSTPGVPTPEEGFFNRSLLDINNDGTPDEIDEVCEDVPYVDVALRKRVNAGTPGPYKYGDIVSFDVEVFNQGNVPLSDIEIVDYIPCGLTYVSGTPSWTLNANQARVTLVGVLAPKASRTIRIDFRIGDCLTEDAWLNITEVMGMEDANGKNVSDQDIDSSPDNDKNNDAGGLEESPADNYVNGDGTGTIGDGVADTDEDDHDPALIPVFDLALRKQLLTSAPYTYNTQHTFRIEVFNQGNVAAYNVEIGDYIPAGYTFVGGLNPLWTIAGSTASTVLAGPVLPGTSTTIDITLVFGMTQGGNTEWFNYAEILSAEDENGNNPLDADSNPDSDSPYERQVIPGGPYDNVVTGGGSGVNEDEDDHDPAGPYFYDLALRKTTTATGPFSYGQIVKFDIEVFNQSNLPVRNIRVIDYIPSGFTGNSIAQNFPTWSFGPNGAVTTLQTTLNPGQSTVVSIYLQVIPTNEFSTGWDNYAEIYRFEDLAGNNVGNQDIDSSPDTNENNDGGGQPYSPADNFVMGDGTGVPGDGVALTDEDDHDPERIEIIDLALRKVLITDGPYAYNDLLHFEIEVFNQGNEPMRNIEITDYIPQGYSFSLADNIGWTGSWPNPQYVIAGPLMPEASTTVNIYLRIEQTTGGYKHWINYAEITDAFNNDGDNRSGWDIDSNPGSNSVAENSVLPDDPEDDDITRNDKGGIEDDHDPAGIEIFDLALYMVNDTDILGAYGDDVRHTVYITNQGSIPSDGFDITVYVPAGYAFNAGDNPGWTDIGGGQVRYTSPAYLEPGQTLSYDLLLEAVPVIDCGDGWLVYAEISRDNSIDPDVLTDFDSRPDAMMINDAGGAVNTTSDDVVTGIGIDRFGASRDIFGSVNPLTDEDDHDPATIRVMDLALYKQLITTAPFQYGDVHEFSICVVNQGNEPMYNIEITDYMAEGYSFDPAKNTGWVAVGNNLQRTLSSIAVCDTVCMSLFLDFEQTTGGRYHWINYAEITQMEDGDGVVQEDVDSRPGSDGPDERGVYPGDPADDDTDSIDKGGEEDDHDPAGPKVFDLALWMENDTEILGAYGDDVTHTIYVTNQGNIASDGFDITVYVPEGYQFNAGDNPGWTDNGNGTVTYASPDLLNPGQTLTYDLLLEAVPVIDCNDGWLVYAEISDDQSVDPLATVDIDSRPDATMINDAGGAVNTTSDDVVTGIGVNRFGVPNDVFGSVNPLTDEDDHDPATIRVMDLALYKQLITTAPFQYGDVHEFSICVVNQGNEPMYNIEITDYMAEGYSFDPAKNTGWVAVGNNLQRTLSSIAVCDTVCMSLFLDFEQTTGGRYHWINYAEITQMEDGDGVVQEDVDSRPGSDGPDERGVYPGDPADDDTDSIDKGGEEDDHDPAGPKVFDLALWMENDTEILGAYGDDVTHTIYVTNQGNIASDGFDITVYVPEGYQFNAGDNPGWTDNGNGTVTYASPDLLNPGQTLTYDLLLEAVPVIDCNDGWLVYAEISDDQSVDPLATVDIDSRPDATMINDAGGAVNTTSDDVVTGIGVNRFGVSNDVFGSVNPLTDEDDHDPATIRVIDLALYKKLLTAGPYRYGQILDFEICVVNQGNEPMYNVELTDYLPQGFVYEAAANAINWNIVGTDLSYVLETPVTVCDTICIPLRLRVVQTDGGADHWINYSEITGMEDESGDPQEDVDSTPGSDGPDERDVKPGDDADDDTESTDKGGEEDDHDPSGIYIYDLALRKTQVDAQSSFRYGDLVTLNMEVFNQGNTGARDIELVDYLPCGMEFVNNASNTANGWTYDENTSEVRTVISNVVEAGASISRILVVRVVECYEDVANAWTNIVEIEGGTNNDTGEPGDDFDSTPDDDPDNDEGGEAGTDTDDEINGDPNNPDNPNAPQDEDDHDPHRIQVFDLALKKTVDDRGPYMIGEVATFRFMVYNQGNVVVQNVNVRDYLRRGFVFHQADNAGWTLTTPAGANPGQHGLLEFTITEAISAGDSVEISVDLEIGLPIGGVTELDWWNYAEIGTAEDLTGAVRTDDADSTPGSDSAYENDVEPDDPWDNEIKGGGPGVAEDEDDHDPEKVIVVGGLGDTVWLDEDGDGTQEPGEPGVGGVTVKLTDCAGHILATQVTDANGFYFFNNLVPGWYQIVMDNTTVPDGLWWTYQNIGADDEIDSDVDFNGVGPCVFITGGQYDSTYDAGLLILAKLGDFVWHDLNGDGMQDAGEPGISGVVVKLHNAAGVVIRTTTTDASGYYLFDDLYPGNYYVQFVQPAGYTDLTLDHQGWDRTKDSNVNHANGQGTTSWITLNPGDVNLTIDAGYYKCVEIGDLLWCDYDYDDKWDNEENGINGLLVNLWRYHLGEWILWDYTYTAHKPGTPSDDGYWYFCAMPGTYYVEIPIPPYGLVPVLPKVGNDPYRDSDLTDANGPGTTDAFTLPSGAKKLDIGAGYYLQACMTNLVWFDENNNGVKDENESGMPGVTVQAYKMGGQLIGTAVTNSQGYFYIEGLRKYAYYLKVTAPNGYTFTTPYSNGNRDMINSDFDHSNGWGTSANYPLNPGECVDLACGLIFSSLPVELIEFRGEYRPDYNYLEWATEREEHSGSFVIERKYENEAKFEQIAEVAAVGNSVSKQTYNLNDYNIPEDGVYYYRLNQLDQDGISRFSKVIAIVVDRAKTTDLSLYPNPTRDRFEIDMSMAQAAFVQIDMFDAQGKLVRKNIMNSELQKGRYTHVVELNGMSEGVYTVRIKIGEKMINKKLVIMH
ncbi:MAG TPA: SdrD B-like domain-containing protein [Saprospiraceae bacterium]|nr:SdrD B-like domain-containing protein [Saprospiraceae bacterium]